MSRVVQSARELIGNTPLLRLNRYEKELGIEAQIYAKLESFNPAGSVKDRIALAMIGKQLGYPVVLTMPASMSVERRSLMKSFGAELIITEENALQGAVDKAMELAQEDGYYMPNQFANPDNIRAHEETTAPEILEALSDISAFVAGVGTGGTVSGVGHVLKNHDSNIKIFALEPAESPLLSTGKAGSHKIQGIGGNFVPENFDRDIVDDIIQVSTEEAYDMARRLSMEEGLTVGPSAGANIAGALQLSEQIEGNIVTILPDLAERYMSTALFDHE